jgi:hypothetical protein
MERLAAAFISPALRLDSGPYGLSLRAHSRPIEAGEPLVLVPAAQAITAEAVLRDAPPDFAPLLSHEREADTTMAIWLLYAGRNVSRPFEAGYVKALREEADIDCTLLWTEDELSKLQRSRAARRARSLRAWAAEEWRRLASSSPWMDSPLQSTVGESNFRWALCAVWSRSFQYSCAEPSCGGAAGSSGGLWRVLAPAADLLNHAGEDANAELQLRAAEGRPERWHQNRSDRAPPDGTRLTAADDSSASQPGPEPSQSWASMAEDDGTDALVLRARRRIDVGVEVTLDYGVRSNADLLTTHGFALEKNPAESSPLGLEPSAADPLREAKALLLASANLSLPGTYELCARHLRRPASDMLLALRVHAANGYELGRLAAEPEARREWMEGAALSTRNERRWRALVRTRASALLEELETETTGDEDAALLREHAPQRELASMRERAALLTRFGEKALLREVLDELELMRIGAADRSGSE